MKARRHRKADAASTQPLLDSVTVQGRQEPAIAPAVVPAVAPATAAATASIAPLAGESGAVPYSGHRVTVFNSADGQAIDRTTRLLYDRSQEAPTSGTADDDSVYVVTNTERGRFLVAVGPDGQPRVQCPLPAWEAVKTVLSDPKAKRLYVGTDKSLLAFDLRTGKQKATREFPHDGTPMVRLGPDGRVLTTEQKAVLTLDKDLKEVARLPVGFTATGVEFQPDGSTLLFCDRAFPGSLLHLAADGKTVLMENREMKHGSMNRDADGSLWFVQEGGADFFGGRSYRVHHYDLATHQDTDYFMGKKVGQVFPLPGGDFMVAGDTFDSLLEVHSGQGGSTTRSYTFGSGEHMRSAYLTQDGRTAYAEIAESQRGEAPQRVLYRLPLEDGRASSNVSFFNPFLPFAPLTTLSDTKEVVLRGETSGQLFFAAVDDGRLVTITRDEMCVVAADGKSSQPCGTVDELLAALGPHARIVSKRLGLSGSDETEADVASLVSEACRMGHGSPVSEAPAETGLVDNLDEGCLELTRRQGVSESLADLGLDSPEALGRLQEVKGGLELALRSCVELPFGDGSRAHVVASARQVEIKGADGEEVVAEMTLAEGCITAVLPLAAGEHHYAAVGTSEGEVILMSSSGRRGRQEVRTALGEPIQSLALGRGNRIYAVGAEGNILMLEPSLPADTTLSTPAPRADEEVVEADKTIEDQDGMIIIGGVAVPKRARVDEAP